MLIQLMFTLCSVLAALGTTQEAPEPYSGVEITFLANEGFILRAGEEVVLIDGFLAQPYSIYAALSATQLEQLREARAPLDGDVLCLASHVHRDHFQAAPAAEFLRRNQKARLWSSPEVIDALAKHDVELAGSERVRGLFPEPGKSMTREHARVQVRFLDLPHGGERWRTLQNLGHLITLGEMRVLHIGDAATTPQNFARHDLRAAEIDVALVPFWFLSSSEGRRVVDEIIHADHVILCHIPTQDRAPIASAMATERPAVIVPRQGEEPRRFKPRTQAPAQRER